mmetsp:Transcript_43865/g.99156  ORF Transcript_43865/g.99156 Transcript_43865/m.99156 type:complete len:155 (-) Transcript_43865:256-720(-)|eukprot:CAMPEP_0172629692 /NCGR_PEP_ID=MMETSP1068-20121228/169366_1 /TAXON_ID=35684 /ORGANISM="Pseudopedinella elastica, Strain CCMP716" /LENGTH=154 /DNA_ID=CAMNT_0013440311 /DNA_START=85 /DNA_END=549 /DNA_ORIENTATION=-
MEDSISPRRIAVLYDPPTIVLEEKTSKGVYHHRLRFKKLKASARPSSVAHTLFRRYPRLLSNVDPQQVIKLISMVLENLPPPKLVAAGVVSTGGALEVKLEALDDLQTADESVLAAAKDKMEQIFVKNFVSASDEGYEHDKRADFEADEESSWD